MAWTLLRVRFTAALQHAQGRSMEDTLALAFGDLAPRMQAAESQCGVVRVTMHACMPPTGVSSKRCQYTCGSRISKPQSWHSLKITCFCNLEFGKQAGVLLFSTASPSLMH